MAGINPHSSAKGKTILVTGATGKTGSATIPLLLARGHTVQALVHREDDRSARLKALGAAVIVGDLLDFAGVTEALKGVDRAYFCFPIAPGLVEATAYFAQAARDARLRAIVNMSQISARRDAVSDAARQHWIAERIFDWSGVPTTHLRPTFFAEWLLLVAEPIAHEGVIPLPFGDGRHAPVAAADQARVIAAILDDPAPHAGQTYPLFGPVEMTYPDIAAEVTRALNKPVRYVPIEVDAFKTGLRGRGMSEHLVQHLGEVALDYRAGRFAGTNDVVRRVGHVDGTTVEQFVDRHRAAFAA